MTVMSDAIATLKAHLPALEALQSASADLVVKHAAIIAELEKMDAAVPGFADLEAMVAKMAAAQPKT